MKIVFFGSSAYVLPVLKSIRNVGELVLVVTTETHSEQPIFDYATKNNLPLLSVSTLKDDAIFEKLKSLNADIGVLASFGLIIGQRYRDVFPYGIINIHPSFLPEYRGTTPVQQAILDGKKQTGVSVIQLVKEWDGGPILGQEIIDLNGTETSDKLYTQLFTTGSTIVDKVVRLVSSSMPLKIQLQDEKKATYTKMLSRESGYIDLKNLPENFNPETLDRMTRAYFPWPGVWTKWNRNGKEVIVKFLPEHMIQVEGKKPMKFKDFLNGYPEGKELLEILLP